MAHEKPIVVHNEHFYLVRDERNTPATMTSSRTLPEFVGQVREINFATAKGMPKHLTLTEKAGIFRAIRTGTTNINSDAGGTASIKAVLWHPPIQACTAMATTFIDRQLTHGDKDRHVRIILRTIPKFHTRPGRAIKTHFAQYVVFLKDSQDSFFVVVQWYDPVGREPFDSISGLAQMELRPHPGITKSYSVMPITSIVNGALITRFENKFWVLLSPRETNAYELTTCNSNA